MSKLIIKEDIAKSAMTELKRKIPYGWDLNIYRGCQHNCQYCYAIGSHKYLGSDSFFDEIHVKTNIVDELEKELRNENWKREVINIGGVTDSYQPIEAKYKLMPEILKLLIKYKTPAIISTKSKLVIRDYDLIDELSRITYINIAATITTMEEDIRIKIEPSASKSAERFEFLKEFRKTNASVGLHVMPIIPYITDSEENFDRIFAAANDANVHYVLTGALYLRGATRAWFLDFIKREFTDVYYKLIELYKKGSASKEYKDDLYKKVNFLRAKYKLESSYMKPLREKIAKDNGAKTNNIENEQLSFL